MTGIIIMTIVAAVLALTGLAVVLASGRVHRGEH